MAEETQSRTPGLNKLPKRYLQFQKRYPQVFQAYDALGAATAYNPHLFTDANTALSAQIFVNANSSFEAAQDRAWGAALTLVLLAFLVTLAARLLFRRRS